jgi:hypothetical protein
VGGSYQFLAGPERLLDARAMFFYYATAITPAMSESKPGTGSAYAAVFRDGAGGYLDGGRTYKVTLPGPIPAKNFWAFTVYDNQTRSLLPTDQKSAGLDSMRIPVNSDGRSGRRRTPIPGCRTPGAKRRWAAVIWSTFSPSSRSRGPSASTRHPG